LGIASLDEYVDVKLIDPPEPSELIERLARVASSGLRFLAAVRLSERDPSISAVITSARYVVALSELALKERPDDAELARRVAAFLERREHRVRRDIGKIGKIIDVRQLTDSVAVGGEAAHAVLDRAGIVGRVVPLELALPIRQNGSAKVAEVVDAVLG